MTAKRAFRLFLSYFLRGLLLIVPITVTVYAIVWLFLWLDGLIKDYISGIPGLGIIVLLAVITIVGYVGSTIIAQPIKSYFAKLLKRAPLLKTVYSSIKDLLSAFVGQKKKFKHPVLVKMNKNSEIERLGFITSEDLSDIGIGEGKVAVYLPFSYSFSGNLFIVPKANVTPVDAKSADVMKFIVSGGVIEVENEKE